MLTFASALKLFEAREGRSKSARLEFNLRLVRLAPDLFGVQFHNTYVVRIWENGHYSLNSSGRRTEAVMKVINHYSPAKLRLPSQSSKRRTEWEYPNGNPYADFDIIDSEGKLVGFKT